MIVFHVIIFGKYSSLIKRERVVTSPICLQSFRLHLLAEEPLQLLWDDIDRSTTDLAFIPSGSYIYQLVLTYTIVKLEGLSSSQLACRNTYPCFRSTTTNNVVNIPLTQINDYYYNLPQWVRMIDIATSLLLQLLLFLKHLAN